MDKKTAKKFLISVTGVFFTTIIISLSMVFTIVKTGSTSVELSDGMWLLICLCSAILPTGTFVGFFTAFMRVKEITKPSLFVLLIALPIALPIITVYGILAIIPYIIYGIFIIIKN